MRVTTLKVANLRAIKEAEFRFQAGFNLIVGVNGVGKTSVLDALRVCLAAIVRHANSIRVPLESLSSDDIRLGTDSLTLNCHVRIAGSEYEYLVHRPRERSAPQEKQAGMPREQVHRTPSRSDFLGEAPDRATGKEPSGRPLAMLFSTSRAVPSDRAPRRGTSAGGIAAAFGEALISRELRLVEFADWMRVQEALSAEKPAAKTALVAFARAVKRFLPGYSNLRVVGDGRPSLKIDHGKVPLNVRQLSDGERGTLALVLDITRRLAQANPHLTDPAKQSEAIILIDEVDLHLHPKWQRQIVGHLTSVFPKCQFIATTHSPQVIGEVDPERVTVMLNGQVHQADRTLGLDSNWILKHVMESEDRPKASAAAIAEVEALIRRSAFKKARSRIAAHRDRGRDLPEWSVLDARIARLEALGK
jgi:ABC-type multidrug transport system ATPase subunit